MAEDMQQEADDVKCIHVTLESRICELCQH